MSKSQSCPKAYLEQKKKKEGGQDLPHNENCTFLGHDGHHSLI